MRLNTVPLPVVLVAAALTVAHPAHAIELNPFGFVKDAVEAAVEDRSAEDIAKDAEIKAKIVAAITDEMGSDMISFSTDVYEQDVMLTGVVETGNLKTTARRLAKGVDGVKKVYNEVLVIPKVAQEKGAVEGFVDDTVIEKKINALLIDAKGVNVTNFRWRSVGGHVFLFGRAFTKDELNKAIAVVRDIKNVTNVTSRVKVVPK